MTYIVDVLHVSHFIPLVDAVAYCSCADDSDVIRVSL